MGRSPLIPRLLVWALAVIVIDAAVIATGSDTPAPSRAQAASSTTTTSATATTTTTTAPSESTSTTLADSQPTSTLETTTTTTLATADTTPPSSTTPSSGEVVVAHLQGDDNPNTASFTVQGRWQVRWSVVGGNGVAATVTNDDQPDNPFFAPMEPGDGSGDFPEGCSCTLHLEPDGSTYDVVVVDLEG